MQCCSSACVRRIRTKSQRCCMSSKRPNGYAIKLVRRPSPKGPLSEVQSYVSDTGDPDLHQYVLYDAKEGVTPQKGPRIINLDDNDGKGKNKEYTPPKSLTVHLSKIDMPELRPRGTPLDRQQMTRRDQDSGKKKEKDQSKRVKEKAKAKTKDNDKDKRSKPTSRPTTSPPQPTILHKQRSQYFPPTSARAPSGSLSQFGPPPLPSRTRTPQHSSGTPRRQSMYGSLNADRYHHDYAVAHEGINGSNNNSSTSGLLGRFLGR